MQRYIIIVPEYPPFTSEWMSEEMFPDIPESVAIDNATGKYTKNGKVWYEMEEDHL